MISSLLRKNIKTAGRHCWLQNHLKWVLVNFQFIQIHFVLLIRNSAESWLSSLRCIHSAGSWIWIYVFLQTRHYNPFGFHEVSLSELGNVLRKFSLFWKQQSRLKISTTFFLRNLVSETFQPKNKHFLGKTEINIFEDFPTLSSNLVQGRS